MALARLDPLQQRLLVRHPQVDEVHVHVVVVVGGDADDVAVFALERGAGDDDAGRGRVVGGEAGDGGLAQEDQPVPSVGVGEGFVLGHFLLVGFGVVLWRGR